MPHNWSFFSCHLKDDYNNKQPLVEITSQIPFSLVMDMFCPSLEQVSNFSYFSLSLLGRICYANQLSSNWITVAKQLNCSCQAAASYNCQATVNISHSSKSSHKEQIKTSNSYLWKNSSCDNKHTKRLMLKKLLHFT